MDLYIRRIKQYWGIAIILHSLILFFSSCNTEDLEDKSSDFPNREPSLAEQMIQKLGDDLADLTDPSSDSEKYSSAQVESIRFSSASAVIQDGLGESDDINLVVPSIYKGALSTIKLTEPTTDTFPLIEDITLYLAKQLDSDGSEPSLVQKLFSKLFSKNNSPEIDFEKIDYSKIFSTFIEVAFDALDGSSFSNDTEYMNVSEHIVWVISSCLSDAGAKPTQYSELASDIAYKTSKSIYQSTQIQDASDDALMALSEAIISGVAAELAADPSADLESFAVELIGGFVLGLSFSEIEESQLITEVDQIINIVDSVLIGSGVSDFKTTNSQEISDVTTENLETVVKKVIARPQIVDAQEDTDKYIELIGIDSKEQSLVYQITDQPVKGMLSGSPPLLVYTPDTNLHGTDVFRFTVSNGTDTSSPADVTIDIESVYDPPTIEGTPQTTANTSELYEFTPYWTNIEGNTLSFEIENRPTWAVFDNTTGKLSGTPQNKDAAGLAKQWENITIGLKDTLTEAAATLPPFTITVKDITPPQLASSYPDVGGTGASMFIDIKLSFDETVDVSMVTISQNCSGSFRLFSQVSAECIPITSEPKLSNNGKTVIVPDIQLPAMDTSYDVILTSDITDVAGNSFAGTEFTFSTHGAWTDPVQFGLAGVLWSYSDEPNELAIDSHDNIYIVGSSDDDSNHKDILLLKFNKGGVLVDTKKFGAEEEVYSSDDIGTDIAIDSQDNVYIIGTIQGKRFMDISSDDYDNAFLIKYNPKGDLLYTRVFNSTSDELIHDIHIDENDQVYLVGNAEGPYVEESHLGSFDAIVIKIDENGNDIWAKQFGSTLSESAMQITTDNNGNIYIVGDTHGDFDGQINKNSGQGTSNDAFITKISSTGETIWTRFIGSEGEEWGYHTAVTDNGNVFVAGYTDQRDGDYPDYWAMGSIFFYVFNSQGDLLKNDILEGFYTCFSESMIKDRDDNIYLTGYSADGFEGLESEGGSDIFIMKFDSSGELIWKNLYEAPDFDAGRDLAPDSSGDIIVTSHTTGNWTADSPDSGTSDILLFKMDPEGYIIETTPPEVDLITPNDETTDLFVDSEIRLKFNESIDINTLTSNSSDYTCSGSVQISTAEDNFGSCIPHDLIEKNGQNRSFLINPTETLDFGTTYIIKATNLIKDRAGNNLIAQSWSFTTPEFESVKPSVAAVQPTDGNMNAPHDGEIVITFNERIHPSSISANTEDSACVGSIQVSLTSSGSCLQMEADPVISSDYKTVTIKPKNVLEMTTNYTVTLSNEIEDSCGNNLNQYSWSFTTLDAFFYDFETNTIPPYFDLTGDANWYIQSIETANDSNYAFSSGDIDDSQESCFSLTYTVKNGYYSFYVKTRSEAYYDGLYFGIDDSWVQGFSGNIRWMKYEGTVDPGERTFLWCYKKDYMMSAYEDTIYIDDIFID